MATAAVFGSTGAVGSQILATLLEADDFTSVHTVSRRLPTPQSQKLHALQEGDTSKWGSLISTFTPKPSVVFNAVGTTRAAAGGIQNQWKIDHDLVIENAKAAKAAGVETFVFISSAGTRGYLAGYVPYSKMKVGVEDAIKELEFKQAIILRPGMIIGREKAKAPFAEMLVGNLHKLGQGLQDALGTCISQSSALGIGCSNCPHAGQDQQIIGRAAVAAARIAEEGSAPSKYWVLESTDVLKYGRNDWKA